MTREEAIENMRKLSFVWEIGRQTLTQKQIDETLEMAFKALEQVTCEDCISRQEVLNIFDYMTNDYAKCNDFEKVNSVAWVKVQKLPSVNTKEPKTDYKSFCEWVASEIFSEDWEFNKDSFDEIACRKLSKLRIVASDGDAWKLKEGEASE